MTELKLKRAYAPESSDDGYRVYIDMLWPQGLSHLTFHYDEWAKNIAPSRALREWFHLDRDANWATFVKKYSAELGSNPAWDTFARSLEPHRVVTLLYSSKNEIENNAVIVQKKLAGDYPDQFEEG